MRIAQVSPLYESVPPKMYGGTERVVSYLTEELVNQGHQVTLFASGDSVTKARLIAHTNEALRLGQTFDPLAHHIVQMQEVIDRIEEFDLLHFHTDYLHFPFTFSNPKPHLTTLHGRLDLPELQYIYKKFGCQPVVSISNSQRLPINRANWQGTIYHGLPFDLYEKGSGEGNYVVFMGRISHEKRPDRAIEIARRAGINIKIAAKIDKVDKEYFDTKISHLMEQPHVEFIGEVGEEKKGEILKNAKALLFPIEWPEPFGMVMIEAMACGTPVIAYHRGSVPEVIDRGETGFIVNSLEEAVKALENIELLDRGQIRRIFEKRFSAKVMASNYVKVYEKLLNRHKPIHPIFGKPNTKLAG
ncbi:glycosyltransferase family 4 protein [Litoribacter ruber]|uniref:Glycosyltransferase family 4 protein n=1 Tax=Litoribacter ruber TaxID=702568 RepID=A0AAP2CJS8_9BACT|nr:MULTISPECIES: glycosyltransferase family 4 protein [Litoribacter]MBS9525039.1 glycosyltransferase family 4 protein [Litoribacter alkaliphilus]MBT0811736.1 glycosyltransferase family 4 protein [Litoribacter ruber]